MTISRPGVSTDDRSWFSPRYTARQRGTLDGLMSASVGVHCADGYRYVPHRVRPNCETEMKLWRSRRCDATDEQPPINEINAGMYVFAISLVERIARLDTDTRARSTSPTS